MMTKVNCTFIRCTNSIQEMNKWSLETCEIHHGGSQNILRGNYFKKWRTEKIVDKGFTERKLGQDRLIA